MSWPPAAPTGDLHRVKLPLKFSDVLPQFRRGELILLEMSVVVVTARESRRSVVPTPVLFPGPIKHPLHVDAMPLEVILDLANVLVLPALAGPLSALLITLRLLLRHLIFTLQSGDALAGLADGDQRLD